jgi:signal peptidase II
MAYGGTILLYLYLTLFAAAIVAVDRWTKALAAARLAGRTIILLPGWLELHYITNDGMALSLLSGARWLFVVLAIAFVGVVVWLTVKKIVHKPFELWCLAAITGGAVGNLIDRIATGQVIDMISVPWFSVFNVADIFITVGAVLLVLYILIWDKELLADKKKDEPHDSGI